MTKTFCDICGQESSIYRQELLTLTEWGNPRKQTYELCSDCMRNIAANISRYIKDIKEKRYEN